MMVAATFKAAIEAAARPYAMAGIYPYVVRQFGRKAHKER